MARVNIEDSLFKKAAWFRLLIITQDEDKALGAVVRAFMVAQQYWIPEKRVIPKDVWERERLNPGLVEAGLVVETEDGFHVRGSEDAFAWWFERQEAAQKGGKVSAARARDQKGRLLPKDSADPVQASPSEPKRLQAVLGRKPSEPKQIQASSSSSSSYSSSFSNSEEKKKEENYSVGGEVAVAPVAAGPTPIGAFIGAYRTAYRKRYGESARLDLTGKVQGQIKRFVQETPLERACALIETYVGMNDQWFLTKGHDFGTFIQNLSKVGLALDTGKTVTRQEAQHAEMHDYHRAQMARIQAGEL